MASCIARAIPRYRILATVQHCLRNSITKTQKHLCCRELRTYAVPKCSVLPMVRCDPLLFGSTRAAPGPVLSAIRSDAFIYAGLRPFGTGKPNSNECDDLLGQKMTRFQKFKYLLKNYWHVAIPVHVVTSCVWLGGFYYLSVSGVDIVKLMESIGLPDSWIEPLKTSRAAHLLTMYTLYKLATPFRYAVTIGGSTLTINFCRQKGWIKPVPNKDQIKQMYQQQKGALMDFKASCQDKIKSTKGDFMKSKEEIKQHCVEARDELQKSVIDTKREIKQGVKDVSSECKHIGGLLCKYMKDLTQNKSKADYVAKLIKENDKK